MKVFSFLFLWIFLASQDKHPIFHKHQDIIQEATEISLWEIAEQPIPEKEQEKNKTYIEDYLTLKKVSIPQEDIETLKKTVLNAENYTADKKHCPMVAKYAIRFSKKRHHITLILSSNTCEKTIIFSSEKSIHKHYHDLKASNGIHQLIERITGTSDK
jgi:hypothetical protein